MDLHCKLNAEVGVQSNMCSHRRFSTSVAQTFLALGGCLSSRGGIYTHNSTTAKIWVQGSALFVLACFVVQLDHKGCPKCVRSRLGSCQSLVRVNNFHRNPLRQVSVGAVGPLWARVRGLFGRFPRCHVDRDWRQSQAYALVSCMEMCSPRSTAQSEKWVYQRLRICLNKRFSALVHASANSVLHPGI